LGYASDEAQYLVWTAGKRGRKSVGGIPPFSASALDGSQKISTNRKKTHFNKKYIV
jgi:hypothetical protein